MGWQPLPGTTAPPLRLADTLDRVLGRLGAPSRAGIEVVFDRWPEVVGEAMAGRTRPVAIAAPPLRTAPIRRVSTRATRHPAACASAAVPSVEALSETTTSTAPAPPRYRSRAMATLSSNRGSSLSSLYAGTIKEMSGRSINDRHPSP